MRNGSEGCRSKWWSFRLTVPLCAVIFLASSVALAANGRPRPGPRGPTAPIDPYCALLDAQDQPHPASCRPTQCEQCSGAWLVACQTFENLVVGGITYYFGEGIGTMAELAVMWASILNVVAETATDFFCGPGSSFSSFTFWMHNICDTQGQSSADCQGAKLVHTCACMGHAGARGTYNSQMHQYCDKCACYRQRTYGSAQAMLDGAKRCLNRIRPRPGAGRGFGDPNLITFNGSYLSDNRAGEFVAVRKLAGQTGPNLEVQFRYQPWGVSNSVSMVTAVALKSEGSRIAIYARPTPEVRINGVTTNVPGAGLLLDGGLEIFKDNDTYYTIFASNGDIIGVNFIGDFMNVSVELTDDLRGKAEGVLGNFDGNPSGDPTSWPTNAFRITSTADSLFDYRTGESLDTFNLPSFPGQPFDFDGSPPEARFAGQIACVGAGVTDATVFQGCIRDHVATGGSSPFLDSAVHINVEAVESQSTSL